MGLGPGNSPAFFGTTEGGPRFEHRQFFGDTKNDWAGDQQPFDKQWLGEVALVSGDFTRFDNSLLLKMWSVPNYNGTPGFHPGGDLGTFMIQEGFAFPLWLQNPYAAKASMLGLEQGLHYFAAFLVGPNGKSVGMRQQKARCFWFCMPIFAPDINNTVKQQLYDFNVSGMPAIT